MDALPLIDIRHVSKTFVTRGFSDLRRGLAPRTVRALDGAGFEVAAGQVVGLLGPNGAGKTTLINVLCDLVRPDSGSVHVAGLRLPDRAHEAHRRIGLVTTNERSFFWRLTGRQNLEFFAALQDVPRGTAVRRSRELMKEFGLENRADSVFRVYSSGMKKRLTLARALLHDPPVLLMDEPTNSLDAVAAEDLIDLVRTRIKPMGKCVLWATHRLDEVAKLCDRVVVLVGGRIRFDDTVSRFRELLHARSTYLLELERADDRMGCLPEIEARLAALIETDGPRVRLRFRADRDRDDASRALRILLEAGMTLRSADTQLVSLGEIFEDLAGTSGDEPPGREEASPD